MNRLVALVVAFALGWLMGDPTPDAIAATSIVHVYSYDAPVHDAVGLGSHGASARSEASPRRSTITYAHPGAPVQVAGATTTTGSQVGLSDGALSPFEPGGVAANGVEEATDIGHAGLRHQFPNTLKGKSQFYDDIDLGQPRRYGLTAQGC